MNVTDLADPVAVAGYLSRLGRAVPLDEAHALAEDALELEHAPAGAWAVLAHVAEHRGDYTGFERWTAAALDVDITFGPSVEDDAYLNELGRGPSAKVGAQRRALHLVDKLDAFCDRHAQLPSVLQFAGRVIEGDPLDHPHRFLLVADNDLFLLLHALEGGMLARFADVAGHLLPPAEWGLAASWREVRHRYVELVRVDRRGIRFVDAVSGEVLDVDASLGDSGWSLGDRGFAAIVPVGSRLALVGQPMLATPPRRAAAERAVGDPAAVADLCLRWLHDEQVELWGRSQAEDAA